MIRIRWLLPILLLCCLGARAQTIVQSQTDKSQGSDCSANAITTCTVLMNSNISLGSTVLLLGSTNTQHLGGASNDCETAVTDNQSNSYTTLQNVQYDSVNHYYVFACYRQNVTNAPDTFILTANASITNVFDVHVIELGGVPTSGVLDVNANTLGPGCAAACTTNNSPHSANFTTATNNEILICLVAETSNTTTISALLNSFTTVRNELNPGHTISMSRTVTSPLTTSCGGTLSAAQFWDVIATSFKAAAGAAVTQVGAFVPGP